MNAGLRFVALTGVVFGLLLVNSLRAQQTLVYGDPREIESEVVIRQRLQKPLTLNFSEAPLGKVVEILERQLSIPFSLDRRALEDAGAGVDTPVTFHCDQMPAREALRQILGGLDLSWCNHEGICITTPEANSGKELVTRVYPVADLVAVRGEEEGEVYLDYDSLIETITSVVHPTTWDEVGGPGSISPFPAAGALVFNQTREVHYEVELLLQALRASRNHHGFPVVDSDDVWQAHLRQQATRPGFFEQPSQQLGEAIQEAVHVQTWQRPREHE